MQRLKILNTREVRNIKDKLKEQFGFAGKLDYAFLLSEKGKLFITNRDIARIDLEKLRVDKYGLYFGELNGKELRLSMEGAWMIGKKAKKNVVELDKEEVKKYFLGEELDKDLGKDKKWALLKYGKDIISCAKYTKNSADKVMDRRNSGMVHSKKQDSSKGGIDHKEGKILNFLPKIHRSKELII